MITSIGNIIGNAMTKKSIAMVLIMAIVLSSNPFGVFDNQETKRVKTILANKETLMSEIVKNASAAGDIDGEISKLQEENNTLNNSIATINSEICGLTSQIGQEDYDPTLKCKNEDVVEVKKEKEEVKASETVTKKGYGYDENGNKMKWMLTRYYSPSYDQSYFKYSPNRTSDGRVKWAGVFNPTNDNDRWNAFMADSLVQCGTSYTKKPDAKNMSTVLTNLNHSCGTPGITPFVDVNNKTHDYFDDSHAYKTMACDYKYIANIADLGCSPTIKQGTAYQSKEWNSAIACRAKINKEITFKVEGMGEAKCADAGNAINGAHLDLWVGYGNTALTELAKGNIKDIQSSSYNIGLDGKKGDARDGFWANVDIYKNGVKVY